MPCPAHDAQLTRPRSNRRLLVSVAASVVVAAVIAVAAVVVGNDFRFTTERVTIPAGNGSLDGVVAMPPGGDARGLVIVVHGDGPVDATMNGLYSPWFEAAADAGFATVSWSKPGVGNSSGQWLAQTMNDRANEAAAVIDWARDQPGLPRGGTVLWGASQAGWVLPKVVAERDDIAAVVAAGPAISWLRQGRYNLNAELDRERADGTERRRRTEISDHTLGLLRRGADYAEYQSTTQDPEPMDAARWAFVSANYTADATADLERMAPKRTPVLLMLGDHDENVDVAETARTYHGILGPSVTEERFDAAHSLARTSVEDNELLGLATGLFRPRALLANGVLDSYREFLGSVSR